MLWILADLALHSFVILLAAEALCRLSADRLAPASRYRLRLAALILVFLSPLMTMLLPEWHLIGFLRDHLSSDVIVQTRSIERKVDGSAALSSLWPVWLWMIGASLPYYE